MIHRIFGMIRIANNKRNKGESYEKNFVCHGLCDADVAYSADEKFGKKH